jgi:hypothetical protein
MTQLWEAWLICTTYRRHDSSIRGMPVCILSCLSRCILSCHGVTVYILSCHGVTVACHGVTGVYIVMSCSRRTPHAVEQLVMSRCWCGCDGVYTLSCHGVDTAVTVCIHCHVTVSIRLLWCGVYCHVTVYIYCHDMVYIVMSRCHGVYIDLSLSSIFPIDHHYRRHDSSRRGMPVYIVMSRCHGVYIDISSWGFRV